MTQTALSALRPELQDGEAEQVQSLVDLLSEALRKRYRDQSMLRAAHPKAHGLVRARFVIRDDIPANLRHGIFAVPNASFDAWVRFSNAGALPAADTERDLRGCAIKLMGVHGKKFLPDEEHTQDLLLQSSNRFIVSTPEEFADLSKWIVRGRPMAYFLQHPRYMAAGLKAVSKAQNPLSLTYWSAVPFALGEEVKVKYMLIPSASPSSEVPDEDTGMRKAMRQTLATGPASFDFAVQPFVDEERTPIDDAWKVWEESVSEPISVARLEISVQPFDDDERDALAESMSFNPWHAIAAHRPLGPMNRVRGALYAALTELRRSMNDVKTTEPTASDPLFRGTAS